MPMAVRRVPESPPGVCRAGSVSNQERPSSGPADGIRFRMWPWRATSQWELYQAAKSSSARRNSARVTLWVISVPHRTSTALVVMVPSCALSGRLRIRCGANRPFSRISRRTRPGELRTPEKRRRARAPSAPPRRLTKPDPAIPTTAPPSRRRQGGWQVEIPVPCRRQARTADRFHAVRPPEHQGGPPLFGQGAEGHAQLAAGVDHHRQAWFLSEGLRRLKREGELKDAVRHRT